MPSLDLPLRPSVRHSGSAPLAGAVAPPSGRRSPTPPQHSSCSGRGLLVPPPLALRARSPQPPRPRGPALAVTPNCPRGSAVASVWRLLPAANCAGSAQPFTPLHAQPLQASLVPVTPNRAAPSAAADAPMAAPPPFTTARPQPPVTRLQSGSAPPPPLLATPVRSAASALPEPTVHPWVAQEPTSHTGSALRSVVDQPPVARIAATPTQTLHTTLAAGTLTHGLAPTRCLFLVLAFARLPALPRLTPSLPSRPTRPQDPFHRLSIPAPRLPPASTSFSFPGSVSRSPPPRRRSLQAACPTTAAADAPSHAAAAAIAAATAACWPSGVAAEVAAAASTRPPAPGCMGRFLAASCSSLSFLPAHPPLPPTSPSSLQAYWPQPGPPSPPPVLLPSLLPLCLRPLPSQPSAFLLGPPPGKAVGEPFGRHCRK